MNKNEINQMLVCAYDVLNEIGLVNDGKVKKAFRSQISTFGAAITTGSLYPAVLMFSEQGSAEVDRSILMKAIFEILKKRNKINGNFKDLSAYVRAVIKDECEEKEAQCKENILNAAIALKLTMNLYVLE